MSSLRLLIGGAGGGAPSACLVPSSPILHSMLLPSASFCSCDIACDGAVLWSGFMGQCAPALLFRRNSVVNAEAVGAPRQEVTLELHAGGCWAVTCQWKLPCHGSA